MKLHKKRVDAVNFNRRHFIAGVMSIALPSTTFADAALADDAGARNFILQLGKETIDTFSDKTLDHGKAHEKFRVLFEKGFDVPYIGRWVLGRFWNQATPDQQREYLALFEQLVIQTYANRFAGYSGETFQISGTVVDAGDTVVSTRITRPSGPPVNVDWRVRGQPGNYHIIDVVVEGVSMGITQRSEFASIIQATGGVDGLIAALKKRNG